MGGSVGRQVTLWTRMHARSIGAQREATMAHWGVGDGGRLRPMSATILTVERELRFADDGQAGFWASFTKPGVRNASHMLGGDSGSDLNGQAKCHTTATLDKASSSTLPQRDWTWHPDHRQHRHPALPTLSHMSLEMIHHWLALPCRRLFLCLADLQLPVPVPSTHHLDSHSGPVVFSSSRRAAPSA